MLSRPQRHVALALLALAALPSCTCASRPPDTLYACGPGFTCPAGQRCEAVRGLCVPNATPTGYVLAGAFAAAPALAVDAGTLPDGGDAHFTLDGEFIPLAPGEPDGGFQLRGRVR